MNIKSGQKDRQAEKDKNCLCVYERERNCCCEQVTKNEKKDKLFAYSFFSTHTHAHIFIGEVFTCIYRTRRLLKANLIYHNNNSTERSVAKEDNVDCRDGKECYRRQGRKKQRHWKEVERG